ncbi:MAG: hypothetical protein IT269_03590 [Saprospiraceae bacterium]|nr:hypothetical protein [Saprospiraceae bacterium]
MARQLFHGIFGKTIGFLAVMLLFWCCNDTSHKTGKAPAPPAPKDASCQIGITDLNCWVERDMFFVTGVCSNESGDWKSITLRMSPVNAEQQPVMINQQPYDTLPVQSSAIPPKGRSAFIGWWSLSKFSATPDSAMIGCQSGQVVSQGAMLTASEQSGVKFMSTGPNPVEKGWQATTAIENLLPATANHPRCELLIYGTDKRLWMTTVLNPEDAQQRASILQVSQEGPVKQGDKRLWSSLVFYDNLPNQLRQSKIGSVEFIPFEQR